MSKNKHNGFCKNKGKRIVKGAIAGGIAGTIAGGPLVGVAGSVAGATIASKVKWCKLNGNKKCNGCNRCKE